MKLLKDLADFFLIFSGKLYVGRFDTDREPPATKRIAKFHWKAGVVHWAVGKGIELLSGKKTI